MYINTYPYNTLVITTLDMLEYGMYVKGSGTTLKYINSKNTTYTIDVSSYDEINLLAYDRTEVATGSQLTTSFTKFTYSLK